MDKNIKVVFYTSFSALFFFYSFCQISVTNSISLQLMHAFGMDAAELASFSSSYFLSNVLLLIPAGVLIDKCNFKKVLLIAILVSVCGTVIIAQSSSVLMAISGRVLEGVGGAFSFIGGLKLLRMGIDKKKLSLAIGLLVSFGFLGGIVAQLPFVELADYLGWRRALLFLALFGVFLTILLHFFFKRTFNSPSKFEVSVKSAEKNRSSVGNSFSAVLFNRYTWSGALYTSFMNLPIIVLAALWSGVFLREADHLSGPVSSVVTTMLFVGIMVGSPLFGYLTKRYAIRHLMLAGSVCAIIVILPIVLLNLSDPFLLAFLFFCLGFFSSSQSLGYPVVLQNNLQENASLASSVCSIVVLGGGALMKVCFGWILDLTWSGKMIGGVKVYSNEGFHLALWILPLAFGLSIVLSFFSKLES